MDPKKVLNAKNGTALGHLPILGGLTKSRIPTLTGLVSARDFIQSLVQSKVIRQIRDFRTKLILLKRNKLEKRRNKIETQSPHPLYSLFSLPPNKHI